MTSAPVLANSTLAELRLTGLQRAQALGYPQRKTEAYRYLNLKSLRETAWALTPEKPTVEHPQQLRGWVREQAVPGRELAVFWNGIFVSELSLLTHVQATELAQAACDWTATLAPVGAEQATTDYFDALNSSHWGRGIALSVPAKTSAKLQVLWLSAGNEAAAWSPSQLFVQVGAGAKLDVFEQLYSAPTGGGLKAAKWVQPEVRVSVAANANVQWAQWQNLASSDYVVQRSRFVIADGANVNALHISVGAMLARHNLDFHIIGRGANARLNGITVVGPGQTADFHTLVDHALGESTTSQLYKGILGSDSQAVFNGRVVIRKGAQKASSEQLNQNLMLSDRAEIDSKPELEIFADDVKATHGSAIGKMNDDEVFYLRSRGISKSSAEEMIALGSVVGLLDDVESPDLKSRLAQALGAAYRRIHE